MIIPFLLLGLSLGFCTSHNVTIIRLLDNPHNSNDELKHIRKDSINASFIKVPGDWDVPGGWTIFPLIERLSLLNADWVLIVSEKTKLNLALLLDVVSSYNKNEPEFIGHVIIDSEPTIIHHYSDSQLSYPLKNSGFLLSKLVVSRLAAAISSDIPRSSFSIDVVYEFAAYLKKQLGVKLKRDRRFCISDDTGCLTSVLTHSKFKRSSKVRRDEIFVGVKTFSGFHSSRVPVVQKTWGKSAEKIVFFSDIEDPSIPTLSTGIKNIERGHCGKTAFILEYFSQLILEDSVLKWLLVADDDTIISLENLREVLSDFDTGKPMIIGERYGYGWNDRSSGYDYITGGGGMVFSKAAVVELVNRGCTRCPADDTPDDMYLGACANWHKIEIIHHNGFHQARPVDYSSIRLKSEFVVSFHKHLNVDPLQIYDEWFGKNRQCKDEL